MRKFNEKQLNLEFLVLAIIIIITYLTSFYNYLLFHTIAELFSIIIMGGIFVIGWNSRKYMENSFFLIIGVSSLFIAMIDLIHTLAYSGMNIFIGYDSNLPTSLWIAARYLQAFSLLLGVLNINKVISPIKILTFYFVITILLFFLIFNGFFPVCYIEGSGLTPFKIYSEYVIISILFLCILLMFKFRDDFEERVFYLMILALIVTMISELAFTFYVSVYGISNLVGHLFKIIAFYLIYLAIIEISIKNPWDTMFRDLSQNEEKIKLKAKNLEQAYSEVDQIFNASLPLRIINKQCEITNVNDTFCQLFMIKREEILGKTCNKEMNHRYCGTEVCSLIQILDGSSLVEYEIQLMRSDGKILTLIVHSVPYLSNTRELLGIIQNYTDITERKQIEKELKKSENNYREIIKSLDLGFFKGEYQGGLLFHNDAFLRILEIPPDINLVGKKSAEFLKDPIKRELYYNKLLKNGSISNFITDITRFDGQEITIQIDAHLIRDEDGKPSEIEGTIIEITEKYKLEKKLKASEAKFRLTFENASDAIIWANSLTGEIINCNNATELLFERKKENIIGMNQLSLHPPENHEYYRNMFKTHSNQKDLIIDEAEIITASGKVVPGPIAASNILIGEQPIIQGIFHDITDMKKAEKKQRESEKQYKLLLDNVEAGVIVHGPEGKIIMYNKTAPRLLRIKSVNLIGKRITDIPWNFIGEDLNLLPIEEFPENKIRSTKKPIQNFIMGIQNPEASQKIWGLVNGYPVLNELNEIEQIVILFVDITELKETEKKLMESEKHYRLLLDNLAAIVIIHGPDGRIISFNKSASKILGLDLSPLIGKKMSDIPAVFFRDDMTKLPVEEYPENIIIATKKSIENYIIGILRSGTSDILWGLFNGYPVLNELNEIEHIVIMSLDISDMKNAQKIVESEKKFTETALNTQIDTFLVFNPEGIIPLRWNKAFSVVTGYSDEEIKALQSLKTLCVKEDLLDIYEAIKKAINEGYSIVRARLQTKSGQKIPFEFIASKIYDEMGNINIVSIGRNITDQLEAEKKIRESAQQWQTTFNAMTEAIFLLDLEQNIIQCNKASLDFLGKKDISEIIEHKCHEIVHGTETIIDWCPLKKLLDSGISERSIAKIGDKWCEIIVDPVYNDEGNLVGATHIITDITERKMAEQKIADLAKFPSENPNPVLRVEENKVVYANKIAKELFYINSDDTLPEVLSDSIKSSFREHKIKTLEAQLDNKTYTITLTPIKGTNYVNIYGMDITDRKEAERRLEEFVSTVSHELRTPITVLIQSISLLKSHNHNLDDYQRERLKDTISRNTELLSEQVEDLLVHSRLQEQRFDIEWEEYNPSQIIKDILELLDPFRAVKAIKIEFEIDESIRLFGDRKRINQIFRIIIDNAIKYSNDNGIIKIKATDHYKGEYCPDGVEGVLFEIEDNGIGIHNEEISKLFQRYFRSKDVKNITGTGIGLTIAKEFINLHGGDIFIESEYRKYTIVYIFLPKVKNL